MAVSSLAMPINASAVTDQRMVDRPKYLADKIQACLLNKVAFILKTSPDSVSAQQNFMDMGMDSYTMITLAKELETELGLELYPTLFFEYQNIEALSGHFENEHAQQCISYFGIDAPQVSHELENRQVMNPHHTAETQPRPPCASLRKNPFTTTTAENIAGVSGDIAIIGMSGYLPKSDNLSDFWRHLEASHDLISEVPPSRWDINAWFDADTDASNKT